MYQASSIEFQEQINKDKEGVSIEKLIVDKVLQILVECTNPLMSS